MKRMIDEKRISTLETDVDDNKDNIAALEMNKKDRTFNIARVKTFTKDDLVYDEVTGDYSLVYDEDNANPIDYVAVILDLTNLELDDGSAVSIEVAVDITLQVINTQSILDIASERTESSHITITHTSLAASTFLSVLGTTVTDEHVDGIINTFAEKTVRVTLITNMGTINDRDFIIAFVNPIYIMDMESEI